MRDFTLFSVSSLESVSFSKRQEEKRRAVLRRLRRSDEVRDNDVVS